jgi:hypothetical protein
LEPEGRPEVPQGGMCATVAIGLKPVVLRVKVPQWLIMSVARKMLVP